MLDLTKLTSAPWGMCPYTHEGNLRECVNAHGTLVGEEFDPDTSNASFCALARNAFDVMMRRGVFPVQVYLGWSVYGIDNEKRVRPWLVGFKGFSAMPWPDPYTALVEADAWYRKHIEKEEGKS